MEPEVVLSLGECGEDELGPYYNVWPTLVTPFAPDYRQAESRSWRHGRQATNVIIQSNMAHLEMQMLSALAEKKAFFLEALPEPPKSTGLEKDYKPRRRGQRNDTAFFGRGKK